MAFRVKKTKFFLVHKFVMYRKPSLMGILFNMGIGWFILDQVTKDIA